MATSVPSRRYGRKPLVGRIQHYRQAGCWQSQRSSILLPAALQWSLQYFPWGPLGATIHWHEGWAHFIWASAITHLRYSTLRPWPHDAQRDRIGAMPKFVIEREIPGAGKLSPSELTAISQKSCGVLQRLGPQIQWLESFVTDDKIYCIYLAPDAETVREHAKQGGFPANRVSEVRTMIDPTTAERVGV